MKHPLFTPDEELDAHLATMQWFEAQQADGHELFTHQELMRGFMWHGHRLPLVHQTQGIWKPAGFASSLTFKTAAPKSGKKAPYTDRIDDDGLLRYKFADSPGKQWTNEAMIEAARRNYPLAWLVGVKPTDSLLYYYVRFPAFIERIDQESSEFIIAIEEARSAVIENAGPPLIERRYVSRWTRARVHQHDFREHVISAYEISCAVCDLPHAQLLEAAHIIPDAEESGAPEVSNGLALCRVHHTAYDRNLIGIDANHCIHVAERARKLETDSHRTGLLAFDAESLTHVPRSKRLRPDGDRLSEHFRRFLEAEEKTSA